MLALSAPYLLFIIFLAIIFCLCKKWYKVVAAGFALLLVFNHSFKIVSLWRTNDNDKSPYVIRVLSFNIDGSYERDEAFLITLSDFIRSQSADVAFLAEDFQTISCTLDSLLDAVYPYSTYHQETLYGGHYFYSKYPMSEVEHLEIECNRFSYCFHCKMAYGNDSISLFGVHMASNNYKGTEASIRPEDIDGITSFSNYLDNIEAASRQRCEEATAVRDMSIKTGGPTIIMGDFNDVSGSKPLNILEDAGFKDAWWEGGFGYGATIHHPLPFRIDHIMYNDRFDLKGVQVIDSQGLSDHNAILAEFDLKRNR